jgi:hypothetical protein
MNFIVATVSRAKPIALPATVYIIEIFVDYFRAMRKIGFGKSPLSIKVIK